MLSAIDFTQKQNTQTPQTHSYPHLRPLPFGGTDSRSARLETLKAQVGALDGSFKIETYKHQALDVGIPKGAVVELLGPARYEFIANFLAEQNRPCLWVQKEFNFFPTALLQRGIDLGQSVFVEAGDDVAWVLKQALQAQVFPFIIGEDFSLQEKELRKMQLLAERSGSSFLHLCSDYRPSWVPMLSLNIEQRLRADGELGFSAQVLRKRGAL